MNYKILGITLLIILMSVFILGTGYCNAPVITPPPEPYVKFELQDCKKFMEKELEKRKGIADRYYNTLKIPNYERALSYLMGITDAEKEQFMNGFIKKLYGNPVINYALARHSFLIVENGDLVLSLVYSVQYGDILVTQETLTFDLSKEIGIHGIYVKARPLHQY